MKKRFMIIVVLVLLSASGVHAAERAKIGKDITSAERQAELMVSVEMFLDELVALRGNGSSYEKQMTRLLLGDGDVTTEQTALYGMLQRTVADFYSASDYEIVPGCMPPVTAAAYWIAGWAPYSFYLYCEALMAGESDCGKMYYCWGLASVCLGLSQWIDYRLCAEDKKAEPDSQALDGLRSDKDFLLGAAIVTFDLGLYYWMQCGDDQVYQLF